jgi:hypothetical protein
LKAGKKNTITQKTDLFSKKFFCQTGVTLVKHAEPDHFNELKMKKGIIAVMMLMCSAVFSQDIRWGNHEFIAVNTNTKVIQLDGASVLEVTRDLVRWPFDLNDLDNTVDGPTFVKLKNADIENGVIEVKMLSRIQENSPFPQARGFIGLAYRIDETNSNFEAMYLRPGNGRAEDQLRRNHSIQYFSYPDHKFSRLRKEANGVYETYADMGLNEWIDIRIEFTEEKASMYINGQKHPNFLVNKMLGRSTHGNIGLWVDIGTVGYFKDLKVTKK